MMNQEVKKTWLKALRSGKYRQGSSYLKRRSGMDDSWHHCCLGVLCEISGLKEREYQNAPGVVSFVDDAPGVVSFVDDRHFESKVILPNGLREATGLALVETDTLASMNDSGKSFEEIALWIEERL